MHRATGPFLRPIPEIFGYFNFTYVLILDYRENLLLILIFLKALPRVISLVHLIVVAARFEMTIFIGFNSRWLGNYVHILL